MFFITKQINSLCLWESLSFVVDLSTACQLQLSSTELLSCLLIPPQLSLLSVFQFMCWVHLNLCENSSLNVETDLLHVLRIHSHPLEELEVLSLPFFSFSELFNGLSDQSCVLPQSCSALHIWGVAPVVLIMHRAEHSWLGGCVVEHEPCAQGWYCLSWCGTGGLDRCVISFMIPLSGGTTVIRSPNEVRPDAIRCVRSWELTKPAPEPRN